MENLMFAKSPIFSRMWRLALILTLLIGMLIPISGSVRADTQVVNPTLPATFAWPSWWAVDDTCDSIVYNDPLQLRPDAALLSSSPVSSWRGIQACGPRPQDNGGFDLEVDFGAGAHQFMFQCTELAKRYLYVAYDVAPITADGEDVASNYASTYPTKFQLFANDGSVPVFPQEGDVLSMESSDPAGHVAIVTELYISGTAGDGYIMLMDQNGSTDGSFRLDIVDYVIDDESIESLGYHPTYWIHPLVGIVNSPSTTLDTYIFGVDSTDNHAWIAGDERPVGYSKRTVTWNWNGSSWQKYNPPTVNGSSYHHYLHDITIDSNGDVWTVGEYLGSRWYTLAYKWDGTNLVWVKKTSANVGTNSSYLNAVADDGSGNIYAAGYYYQSGNKPLLLKWNGTSFADQSLALPSGVSAGTLTDVSFSSSSNGWLAGSLSGYVYHYDGSSWTPVALPSGTHIEKVVAVSDTEAWGVAYYYTSPSWGSHLFHYTTAGGWQEISYSFPASTKLSGISAEGESNVWAVGSYAVSSVRQPYMMRFDGSSWSQVSTQTSTYGGYIMDVSIESGIVWGAGDYKATSSSTPYYPRALIK